MSYPSSVRAIICYSDKSVRDEVCKLIDKAKEADREALVMMESLFK